METKIKILTVGTGAIGAYFSGRLSLLKETEVSTVCRSDYDTVRDNGFTVKSIDGDFIFTPHRVIKSASEYADEPDFIIITLKVLPEIDTVALVKEAVAKNTVLVLIQNGIYIEQPLAEAFPENEIISATARIAVTRIAPGLIEHLGYGSIKMGSYPSGVSPKTELLKGLFSQAGVACETVEDIRKARWEKLVWNAPFNPISVLCHADTKQILGNPVSAELAKKIMYEVCLVAESDGCPLAPGIIETNIYHTEKLAPYKTSMLVDFENGRPLEVEAIIGNIIKTARKNNVDAPHLESIYALLKLADGSR